MSLGGKGDGTGKKTDSNLQMPETVRPRNEQLDQYDKYLKDKTVDGRPLRLKDEDPELRPGDTVLIDLVTIERRRRPVVQDSSTMTASAAGTSALNGRNGTTIFQQQFRFVSKGHGREDQRIAIRIEAMVELPMRSDR